MCIALEVRLHCTFGFFFHMYLASINRSGGCLPSTSHRARTPYLMRSSSEIETNALENKAFDFLIARLRFASWILTFSETIEPADTTAPSRSISNRVLQVSKANAAVLHSLFRYFCSPRHGLSTQALQRIFALGTLVL